MLLNNQSRKTHLIALAALAASVSMPTKATLFYDADVTPDVINGSGIANGGFTIDRSNGVELGLRGKLRFNENNAPENTYNSNGDGTYTFDAGLPPTGFSWAPNSPSTARWSFDWSINSDYEGQSSRNLIDLTYIMTIDFDPAAVNSSTLQLQFDPINVTQADHAIGDNTTGNGGGVTATSESNYTALITNNNVAQNSWNMEFFDSATYPFDGRAPGIYDISLEAFDDTGSIASVTIQVESVPLPGTLALLGIGIAGFGWQRRRKA